MTEQQPLFGVTPQPAPERAAPPKNRTTAICPLHRHIPGDRLTGLFLADGHLWWKDHAVPGIKAGKNRPCFASGATLCSLPIETQEAGAQGDPPRCPCTTRPTIR